MTSDCDPLEQAIRSCDEALFFDSGCVKALFRRATAREAKGQYDEAKVSAVPSSDDL